MKYQSSSVSDSLLPHGVAHGGPLSMEFSRPGYWCVASFLQQIFLTGDQPHISCISIGRWTLREATVLCALIYTLSRLLWATLAALCVACTFPNVSVWPLRYYLCSLLAVQQLRL